jgi:hypothetical protein
MVNLGPAAPVHLWRGEKELHQRRELHIGNLVTYCIAFS